MSNAGFARTASTAGLLVVIAACATTPQHPESNAASLLSRIDADRIVAIADGDFLATTYNGQHLTPANAPHRDVLADASHGGIGDRPRREPRGDRPPR